MDDNKYKDKQFVTEDVFDPGLPTEIELAPLGMSPKKRQTKPRDDKKLDAAGISYFGERFNGYMKIEQVRDLIPAFKDLYYQRMVENKETRITHVLREFNDIIYEEEGRHFFPNTSNVRAWKKKWDRDLLAKRGMMLEDIKAEKHVQQVLKTRASGDMGIVDYVAPSHETLEEGLQTLGGELMNDAMQMLRDDQALEDIYDSDELIKRKSYVVNVFGHVTKMVHGKASLMLKASQEKRESAGFLMDLMRQATAGKMSAEEINMLKQNYQPRDVEPETNVTRA